MGQGYPRSSGGLSDGTMNALRRTGMIVLSCVAAALPAACGDDSGSSGTVPTQATTTSDPTATTIPGSQPPTASPGGATTVPGAQPSVPGATPGQDIDELDPPGGTFPGPETNTTTP